MHTTVKVFWDDPYLAALDTVVTAVDGCDVRVAATIFYAESGGQESDAGSIGGHAVLGARKEGLDIVYTLAEAHGLGAGDRVAMTIDQDRRQRLMRLHFAAELVLELVCRRLAGVEKTGAHIGAHKARIDFSWPESVAPLLPALAEEANALVRADLAIISAFEDRAAERRYWEIEGYARVPCGGTHPRRTGELGAIVLRRKNVGRGRERIEITVA